MITAIYIGTERLDLFEDENIVIKSNVSKIEDITKIFTDTSNTFTVPATDVNNAIFKHWYNADIINSFDARKKVPATIELGGINFKVGKLHLNNVNFKNGQPYSYSLDYFGNLVELKDLLSNDKLVDLDLSSLNFEYNYANVKNKLESVQDVCYSLLSKRRLLFDSSLNTTESDTQTNIDDQGINKEDLFASVKQIKIIEAIELKYSLTFSRDFFGSNDFLNQFLVLSGQKTKTENQIPLTNSTGFTDGTVVGNTMMAEGVGTPSQRLTSSISLSITVASGFENVVYSPYIKNGNVTIARAENIVGNVTLIVNNIDVEGGFNDVTFYVAHENKIDFTATIRREKPSNPFETVIYNSGPLSFISFFLVNSVFPDIKIIDYLSGIFKMFKLIAIANKDGTIYVDSLNQFYRKGKVYDFSEYVDYNSSTVSRGTVLNEISYLFEEPKTLLNIEFEKQNNIGFGDLKLEILDENQLKIQGQKLEYKVPFEQIVYEKIKDINNNVADTNLQYGLILDEKLQTVKIKPHFHYIENRDTSIKLVNDSNVIETIINANIPSHTLDFLLQTHSTTFGSEFNTFDGSLINNTIYSNYHKNFIERVFSKNKRELSLKAKDVPRELVLKLNLNDVIQIKNNYHRIESFETNTTDNNIQLNLINDRDVDLTPLISITMDSTEITMDSTEITMDTL